MSPEEMQRRVLYRDGLMLVVDKPAGQAVHPGPKGGPSLLDYFDALRFGLPRSPGLAHRLDRDTSGCLVLGRHRKALAHLGALFRHARVRKLYWAVVEGGPNADEGVIDLPLGRLDVTRGWWMKPDPHGQPAKTTWRVMGRFLPLPACGERSAPKAPGEGDAQHGVPAERGPHPDSALRAESDLSPLAGRGKTWLALEPLTGRTHQLRVHCAAMGWPVVGDAVYGTAPRTGGPPLHLHAREVVVPLYPKRDPVQVIAPVPAHMRETLSACGWDGKDAAANEPAAVLSTAAP
jgi:tRNA pseudouridine32 synthase / 23S rRNA pseudouridine746 synthase